MLARWRAGWTGCRCAANVERSHGMEVAFRHFEAKIGRYSQGHREAGKCCVALPAASLRAWFCLPARLPQPVPAMDRQVFDMVRFTGIERVSFKGESHFSP